MNEESIAFDSVLHLCQNQRRRVVLGTLAAEQRSLTLNDLTKTVLKRTQQTPITEASEEVLTEIRLSLYHAHLPKLAAEGLIEYGSERHLAEPTEQLDQIRPTLSTVLDADSSLEAPMELERRSTAPGPRSNTDSGGMDGETDD